MPATVKWDELQETSYSGLTIQAILNSSPLHGLECLWLCRKDIAV